MMAAECNRRGDIEMQSQRERASPVLTQEDIEVKPWKYLGYHSFANFIASDADFFILRRFGALNARVLLGLQDQLSQLEERLNELEDHLRSKNGPNIHNGSFRQETQKERAQLLSLAQSILHDYSKSVIFSVSQGAGFPMNDAASDELVLQHSQLQARPQVPKKDVTSLQNWFYNNKDAILNAETEYANHTSDLFSLVPSIKTPLRSFLERSRRFRLLSLWREERKDTSLPRDEYVHYSSDKRIDRVLSLLIMLLGLAMLIAPLWILAFVGDLAIRLGVICAFIVLFVALISVTTVAKPFESLAAAAA